MHTAAEDGAGLAHEGEDEDGGNIVGPLYTGPELNGIVPAAAAAAGGNADVAASTPAAGVGRAAAGSGSVVTESVAAPAEGRHGTVAGGASLPELRSAAADGGDAATDGVASPAPQQGSRRRWRPEAPAANVEGGGTNDMIKAEPQPLAQPAALLAAPSLALNGSGSPALPTATDNDEASYPAFISIPFTPWSAEKIAAYFGKLRLFARLPCWCVWILILLLTSVWFIFFPLRSQ